MDGSNLPRADGDNLGVPLLQAMTTDKVTSQTVNLIVKFCQHHSESPICEMGFYGYKLNHDANVAFLCMFCALLAYFAIVGRHSAPRAIDFTITMCLGLVCEGLGYTGRVLSTKNQFASAPFFMQICTLTIGPTFMAASLYILMRRMVFCFGEPIPMLAAQRWTRFVS